MIICPNCSAKNLDGTLFCDECIWDLTGVESVPEQPKAPAAPMAHAVDVSLVDQPLAEEPLVALTSPLPEAEPLAEAPLEQYAEAPAPEAYAEAPPPEAYAEAPAPEAYAEAPPLEAEAPALDLGEPPPPMEEPIVAAEIMPVIGPVSGVIPAEPVSMVTAPELEEPAPSPAKPIAPLAPGLPLSGHPPRLVVVRGVKTSAEYSLMEGPNFIGRFDEMPVDIDLSDQEPSDKIWTSRQHACVTWDKGGGLNIEDLNSANGTYINRNKIGGGEKKALRNGDYIQVGAVLFQVKM